MIFKLVINIAIIAAFGLCYTEWGNHQSVFIGAVEYDILFGKKQSTDNFSHPIILTALIGQIMLIISSWPIPQQKLFHKLAVLLLGIVPAIILLIGLLSLNFKMLFSTIPFFALSIIYYVQFVKTKKAI